MVSNHKTSLTTPLFTEVPVPSQESERSYIYVLGGIDFASFYDFLLNFGSDTTVRHILLFALLFIRGYVDVGNHWPVEYSVNSFNIFPFSCATSGVIFNLLKAVSIW